MVIVQIAGIISVVVVILTLAYLYRESALIEGKSEVGIGPWKFSLGGSAQKKAEVEPSQMSAPPPAKIEQSAADLAAADLGRIENPAPEIHSGAGEIAQTASGGGTITDGDPKTS